MRDDMTLVREFAAGQSEPAFAALVERHLGLVHSAARRQVGDDHLAQEITQAVFIIFARKAAALGPQTMLSAWLYRTTHYAAADALKARRRRQAREQEAFMQSILNEPDTNAAWTQLAPLLDDALNELGETDRTALVLRYFENKSASEIAAALRMKEDAVQKRVTRALDKLRARFVKRGVTLTATVLAGAVAANAVQAAPVAMAIKISVVAAKGAAVTTSITTLVKGTLKIMEWTKAKTAIAIGIAVILATGTTMVVVKKYVFPPFDDNKFYATTLPTHGKLPGNMISKGRTTITSHVGGKWSLQGLLNSCMETTGFRYLIDTNLVAATIDFAGYTKTAGGKDFASSVEDALQTGTVEWWDMKTRKFRKESLVLIKYPDKQTVLVMPIENAAKYK